MSYKENGATPAPRLPQSPTKFSHGIVNIQTSSSNVRSNNVHSNRFTSNLSGRFFSNTTLDAATYKRKLEERQEKKKQALSERDRNVQLLEEEVERVKNEIKKKAIERERRQKRIESRRKRFLLYKAALMIQSNFRRCGYAGVEHQKNSQERTVEDFCCHHDTTPISSVLLGVQDKRLQAAKTIQGWIKEAMHQRQLTRCRKLWGAISMQKLFRGYISRKKSAEEQIKNARRIVMLQSLFRKRLALRVLRTKISIRNFCLDILAECIDLAVPEDDETEENNAGNGFQLFITGTIQHTGAEGCSSAGAHNTEQRHAPAIIQSAFSPKISVGSHPSIASQMSVKNEAKEKDRKSSTASGVVNVIRGLKRLKLQKPNDECVDLKVNGLLRVAEIEKKRREKIRERAKIYKKKHEEDEILRKQYEQEMEAKKQREKEEREKRFNDGRYYCLVFTYFLTISTNNHLMF